MVVMLHSGDFATDFRQTYWPAAHTILHGGSPYAQVPHVLPFPYQAVVGVLLAPFGWLGVTVGGLIFTALSLACLLIAMRLLSVRDWRLYGLVLLWLPVIVALQSANVTLLLLLGIAVVWRYRGNAVVAGVAAAMLVSVKPIMWPLLLWLVATRRYRAVGWTVGVALVVNVPAWWILGFGDIHRYVIVMQQDAQAYRLVGYTVVSLLLRLHVASGPAYVLGIAPGVVACAACLMAGRNRREPLAMVLCVVAILLCTPLAWLHYFSWLIVPLALTRPRLGSAWALPLLMWVCVPMQHPATWAAVVALAAMMAVLVLCLRAPREPRLIKPALKSGRRPTTTSLLSGATPAASEVIGR